MQIHTEFRGIPGKIYYKNTAEFRVFFKKFRIPPEVKTALPWTPYPHPVPHPHPPTLRPFLLPLSTLTFPPSHLSSSSHCPLSPFLLLISHPLPTFHSHLSSFSSLILFPLFTLTFPPSHLSFSSHCPVINSRLVSKPIFINLLLD
jgi:hypothetical protein